MGGCVFLNSAGSVVINLSRSRAAGVPGRNYVLHARTSSTYPSLIRNIPEIEL